MKEILLKRMILNPLPKTLYHYCPLDSFFCIVQSKTLWLSSAIYSNDPSGSKIGENILHEIFDKTKRGFKKTFLDKLLIEFEKFNKLPYFNNPYVFCLSERNEDLNQWRIYSDNGHGVLLSFNTAFYNPSRIFKNESDSLSINPKFEEIYLEQCIYYHDEQYDIIDSYLNLFSLAYKEFLDKSVRDNIINNCITYINFLSAFLKDESYKEEREWRLVCFPLVQQGSNPGSKFKFEMKYRHKRSVIIPYIVLPINATMHNPLFPKVLLGSNLINSTSEILNFIQNSKSHVSKAGKSDVQIQELS